MAPWTSLVYRMHVLSAWFDGRACDNAYDNDNDNDNDCQDAERVTEAIAAAMNRAWPLRLNA